MDPPLNSLRTNFPPCTNSTKNVKKHNETPSHPIPALTSTTFPSPLSPLLASPRRTPLPAAHRHPKLPTRHSTPGPSTRRKPPSWEGALTKTTGATCLASTRVDRSAAPPHQHTPALVPPARQPLGPRSSCKARTTGPVRCLSRRPSHNNNNNNNNNKPK